MRIFYHLSHYVSHRVSGLEYAACLRALGCEVGHDPALIASADAAVLHDDPLNYPLLFSRHPELASARSIALCVWENERLPQRYIEALRLVCEIWTPSEFSRRSMTPHFARVHVLPHVVRRHPASAEDMAFARAALQTDAGGFRFFSIVDSINPRKNVQGLLTAFAAAARAVPGIRLVLKQYRCGFDLTSVPGVISLEGDLEPGQMAALHRLCDAYVSAHHAEGWGLGLSEAMAYGKPVIATGWSGNMEFMDRENSFPIDYTLVPVSGEMCRRLPLCSPDMRWAAPDLGAFAAAMRQVARGRIPAALPGRAAAVAERFGPENIARRLRELLGA